MITTFISESPVPSSDGTTGHSGDQTCSRVGDAKNIWFHVSHFSNVDLGGIYNVGTLAYESSFQVLFEELEGVKWDIIGSKN